MSIARTVFLFALAVALSACMKDQQEVAQAVGLIPAGCGTDGARLEASVDGSSYCANMNLSAIGDNGSVLVTGVDMLGNTLVLQMDDGTVGEHAITEADNGVLYMQLGMTYVVAPGTAGTLTILAHDTDARRLQASFSVPLYNELNGNTRSVSGSLEVTYTSGE